MRSIAAVIHAGVLNAKPLRFYCSPLQGMHLPWHAWEDMQACLDFNEDMRTYMRRCLMSDWATDVRTVPTADGIVTIAPHWMAQGAIGAIAEIRGDGPAITIAYQQQVFDAWKALMGDMPAADAMELLTIALCNQVSSKERSQ